MGRCVDRADDSALFQQRQEEGRDGGRRAVREEQRSGRGAETTVRPHAQVSK